MGSLQSREFEEERRDTARSIMKRYEADHRNYDMLRLEELRDFLRLPYTKGDPMLSSRMDAHLAEIDAMINVGIEHSKSKLAEIEQRSKETALSDWTEWESTQTFGDPDLAYMKAQVGVQLERKLYQHIVDLLTDKEKHLNRGELLRRVKRPIGVPELDERVKEFTDEYVAEQRAIAEWIRDRIRSEGGTLTASDWGY